jgi:hypothetical protein
MGGFPDELLTRLAVPPVITRTGTGGGKVPVHLADVHPHKSVNPTPLLVDLTHPTHQGIKDGDTARCWSALSRGDLRHSPDHFAEGLGIGWVGGL